MREEYVVYLSRDNIGPGSELGMATTILSRNVHPGANILIECYEVGDFTFELKVTYIFGDDQ